jgi:hypothetical protein
VFGADTTKLRAGHAVRVAGSGWYTTVIEAYRLRLLGGAKSSEVSDEAELSLVTGLEYRAQTACKASFMHEALGRAALHGVVWEIDLALGR